MTEVLGHGLPAQLYIAAPSGTWERREPKQYRLTPAAEAPATGKRRRSIRVRGTEPPLARNSSALSERGRPLRRVNSGAATARAPDWAAGASWGEAGRQVTASRDAFAQANVPNPRQPVREHLPRRSQARRQPAVDGPGGRASGTAVRCRVGRVRTCSASPTDWPVRRQKGHSRTNAKPRKHRQPQPNTDERSASPLRPETI